MVIFRVGGRGTDRPTHRRIDGLGVGKGGWFGGLGGGGEEVWRDGGGLGERGCLEEGGGEGGWRGGLCEMWENLAV